MSKLGKALQGAAAVAVPAALEAQRAMIMEKRDARLQEYARQNQERGFKHAEGMQERGFTHSEGMQERGFTHAEGMQERGFTHAEGMQTRGFEHAEGMQSTALEAAAQRHRESLGVQREGQAIQSRRLDIEEKNADLGREIKQIELNNAKEVNRLREQYQATKDPAERSRLSDTISMLTGKSNDNYLPVPLKDHMDNVVGYEIFDKKRGVFVDKARGGAGGGRDESDPLGIRGTLPKPKAVDGPSDRPAGNKGGGLINSALAAGEGIPGAPPLNPEAVASFDGDSKSLTPQQLVEKYKPVLQSLSARQQAEYYAAEKKIPSRVPFIGR